MPIALAVVTAVLSPALVTPRKLRHDLAADTAMLDRLPRKERADLREDIQRRARQLIAATRWPTVTLYDLLALLGVTAISTSVIFAYVLPMTQPDNDGLLLDP